MGFRCKWGDTKMSDGIKRKKNQRVVDVLLVIIWMVLIFVMSGASADTSRGQSGIVVELVRRIFNISSDQPELLDSLATIVRKCAHAFEYFVLGILLLNVIRQFWPMMCKKSWVKYWYLAVVGAAIYAVTDEVHQAFVPGRSCELRDIIIDTVAAGVGVGMVMLLRRWWRVFDNCNNK